jgi:hypothetical protein
MKMKALTVITALILSGALISCSQQEQMAENKQSAPGKASSSIAVPAQPVAPSQPVVLKEFAQEITADSNIEKMSVGKIVEIPVRVKNISQETWPAGTVENPVNLAYHWLDSTGKMIVLDGMRTPLPNDLAPGSSVNLQAKIQAPDQPGSYTLQLTVVQESVAWFENKGAKTLNMPVTVTE